MEEIIKIEDSIEKLDDYSTAKIIFKKNQEIKKLKERESKRDEINKGKINIVDIWENNKELKQRIEKLEDENDKLKSKMKCENCGYDLNEPVKIPYCEQDKGCNYPNKESCGRRADPNTKCLIKLAYEDKDPNLNYISILEFFEKNSQSKSNNLSSGWNPSYKTKNKKV